MTKPSSSVCRCAEGWMARNTQTPKCVPKVLNLTTSPACQPDAPPAMPNAPLGKVK